MPRSLVTDIIVQCEASLWLSKGAYGVECWNAAVECWLPQMPGLSLWVCSISQLRAMNGRNAMGS